MSNAFIRCFDVAFKNGTGTKAMIVSNGSTEAKPKSVVEYNGSVWRYRRQIVDKLTGAVLPEFLYFQDDSVKKISDSRSFFDEAA